MLRRRLLYNKGGIDYSSAGVGDILCSDMSFVSATNFASSGKTAIGIIVINSSRILKVMSLSEFTNLPWSTSAIDITGLVDVDEAIAQTDMAGRGNTDIILAQLGTGIDYAAGKCNAFSTGGTSAGKWYLPSVGELYAMLSNFATINSSLSICSGILLTEDGLASGEVYTFWYYWASGEKTASNAYDLRYHGTYLVSIFNTDKTKISYYDSENTMWFYCVTRPFMQITY